MPVSSSEVQQIQDLIAGDRLPEAIQRLKQLDLTPPDQHTLTLLENRYYRWWRDQASGTQATDDLNREHSRISRGLLGLVADAPKSSVPTSLGNRAKLWPWGMALVLVLLVGVALVRGLQPDPPTNSTTGANSPIINAGGDVDYRQEPQPIQVPENLRQHVTDTTLLDTTP